MDTKIKNNTKLFGAIIGDIVGSRFEFNKPPKSKDFELLNLDCKITDDTVMTLAVAKAILDCNGIYTNLSQKTIEAMQQLGSQFRDIGYGDRFYNWLFYRPIPYNSCGNGSAMRVSPISYIAESEEQVKELSEKVTVISHSHEEGIKGAEAVALAIFWARNGKDKAFIKENLSCYYPILNDEDFTIENLVNNGYWQNYAETCQDTVPHSILCFLESNSFEDTIRNSVYIGGDTDTIGAIAGSIAEAYYGIDETLIKQAYQYLPKDLQKICEDFSKIIQK